MSAPRYVQLAFLLFLSQAAMAAAPDGATLAMQGNGHGAMACMACHGADGGGQAAAGFPRLAGLDATYIAHQLDSFADGSRDNAVMKPVAAALSKDERAALARYYSQLPPPASANPVSSLPQDKNALGRTLATRGRWAQQLPACEQCHGAHGVGVGAHFPPLAGQSATYIANELRAWQQGKRKNDPMGLMQQVASHLSDKDIQAVADWFAAQPLTASTASKPSANTQGGAP